MANTFEEVGREKLRELLPQCTKKQQEFFIRMYVSVDVIPFEKIDWAIQQVERTIKKNQEKENG